MNAYEGSQNTKRRVIRKQLLQAPERSNRSIAKLLGVSDKTVATVRKDLESRSEIPAITHTIGQDGRKQLSIRSHATPAAPEPSLGPSSEGVFFAQTIGRYMTRSSGHPAASEPAKDTDPILTQVRVAFARGNALAICFGLLLGGFVPVAVWSLMHLDRMEWWHPILVAGGAVFSALTVVDWGTIVFRSFAKAMGFAVLVEGAMLGSQILWLSVFALCLLVVINGVNSAVNLVRDTQRNC